MDKEIDLILNILQNPGEENEYGVKFWHGKIGKNQITLTKCGIGKVNSALNTLKLIQLIHPDLVINSGVAGGAGIPIGSVLIADKVSYNDVWCGPGTVYGQADGMPLYMKPSKKILDLFENLKLEIQPLVGLICSGDKFISTAEEITFIRSKFPDVKAVDMESASIAQTCISTGTEFAIIRVVSDTPGEGENISQYKDFWNLAPQQSFKVLKKILENL